MLVRLWTKTHPAQALTGHRLSVSGSVPQVVLYPVGCQLLSQACDLVIVLNLSNGCISKMNTFKWTGTVPERVQVDDAGRST